MSVTKPLEPALVNRMLLASSVRDVLQITTSTAQHVHRVTVTLVALFPKNATTSRDSVPVVKESVLETAHKLALATTSRLSITNYLKQRSLMAFSTSHTADPNQSISYSLGEDMLSLTTM